ncbi:hypothetical protein H9651_11800 [Microbacterium sp. Sa4CUA7]|uniref:DUF2207 domain-containing protein n=1 Tax=Microbacterium pullorum TaxID=2762236 RepID=A0ABR8S4C6_9MICO|nr:hypothetical protein [Microbacterium pullorum]MBD7958327.1 hypothetical protein [Microbacterium pullorum]
MSRYVYLLSTLPPSVVERAHEAAFRKLPLEQRREMFEKLRPFMTAEERVREPQPEVLAGVFRRLTPSGGGAGTAVSETERTASRAAVRADVERRAAELWPFNDPLLFAVVASHFITSATVVSYFTIGAGSIGIAGEPAWVGELGGVPADAGGYGFDGGGLGDGGFGGGFDGGGFGGGFDGGGGMG